MTGQSLSVNNSRLKIFGMPFDLLVYSQLVADIQEHLNVKKRFEYCVTPNVDHVVRLSRVTEYRGLYDNALWSVCDSRILQVLAKLCGVYFPEIIAGSDLTKRLFDEVIQPEDDVLIIGSESSLVARLIESLGLANVVHHNPPMGFIDQRAEVEKCLALAESREFKYLFFAVGSPRQELLAHEIRMRGKAGGVGFCIGASIDFLAGTERRAPLWVQKLSMEWFYRFLQNPRKLWRRYFVDGMRIFPLFIKEFIARGKK